MFCFGLCSVLFARAHSLGASLPAGQGLGVAMVGPTVLALICTCEAVWSNEQRLYYPEGVVWLALCHVNIEAFIYIYIYVYIRIYSIYIYIHVYVYIYIYICYIISLIDDIATR